MAALKSAVLAGEAAEVAAWARDRLADAALGGEYGQPDSCDSPTSCYALAVAALVEGDNALAGRAAEGMREGDAFGGAPRRSRRSPGATGRPTGSPSPRSCATSRAGTPT